MQQWDLSCLDWVERLSEGRSLVPPLPLFEDEAAKAVRAFNMLRLADVEGKPQLEDAVGEWFRDIVRAVFGSYDMELKRRYIREVLLLVPKKNAKTSYGALLMLTALLMNRRPRAKFIMTAPTQDVTELAFSQAKGAVEEDPVLDAILHVRDHLKTIEHRNTRATLEIMTFDPATLTGQKPAGILIDELHVLSKMAKAASAIRQLRGGMLAMPEAFLIFTTTQSEEQPQGVFATELKRARAIRDGEIKGGIMLPILYEFPDEWQKDQAFWRDEANWSLVMPNLGRPITIDGIRELYNTALLAGPGEERAWASQHLNIQIGVGLRSDGWKGAKHWDKVVDKTLTLEELIRRCEPRSVVVGIDGGGLDDLTGLAVLGRERGTRRWLLWNHAWCHHTVLEDRKEIAAALRMFEQDGDLTFIDDESDTDRTRIADIVELLDASGALADDGAIGLDPAATSLITDELVVRGFPVKLAEDAPGRVIGVRQGSMSMNGLIRTVELRMAASKVVHAGSRLMNWCAGNAVTVQRGNATAIEKAASHNAKIDPLMATFNAAAVIQRVPDQAPEYQAFLAG